MSTFLREIRSVSIIFIMSLLTFILIAGCEKSDSITLSGTVESTQIEVNSEAAGKVISVAKEEGTLVKKNDIIAVIDSSMQELSVKQQQAVVKAKQAKLDELKAGPRVEQLQQAEASVKAAKAKLDELKAGTHPEQLKQAQSAVDTAKTSVDTAQIGYDYWQEKYNSAKSLYDIKKLSESELLDTQYKLDTASQQLKTAKEQLKTAQSQLDYLKNGASSQSIQAAQANYEQAMAQYELTKKGSTIQSLQGAEADLEQSKAALKQSELQLSKYQVRAPSDGTLILNNVSIGYIVNTGTSVGTISDLNDLWVKVYIPQKHLNDIKLNQEISLISPAAKDISIKGKVVYIASESEFTPKNTETNDAKENTVFKVKIKLLDNIEKLKPGVTVNVNIPVSKE